MVSLLIKPRVSGNRGNCTVMTSDSASVSSSWYAAITFPDSDWCLSDSFYVLRFYCPAQEPKHPYRLFEADELCRQVSPVPPPIRTSKRQPCTTYMQLLLVPVRSGSPLPYVGSIISQSKILTPHLFLLHGLLNYLFLLICITLWNNVEKTEKNCKTQFMRRF